MLVPVTGESLSVAHSGLTSGVKSAALVGSAGVHHVASELSRRGLIALPTIRNMAGYDVIVTTIDGCKHANIQVKTSLKRVNFFPMPRVDRMKVGPRDWYVLLRWLPNEQRFEGFMLTGRQALEEVKRDHRSQQRRIASGTRTKFFSAIYVGPRVEVRAKKWRRRWTNWNL